jgi:hypothetical protein
MSGIERQPLQAAVKRALQMACEMRRRSSASAVAMLAVSAVVLAPQARGDDYFASDETELRDAIDDANLDPEASATITLNGNITLASTTAFSALTKPITINTNGYTLAGQSGTNPGGTLEFSGNTVSVTGTGELRGGNGLANGASAAGGAGLRLIDGSAINTASIMGGTGGDNATAGAGTGGIGVWVTNGSLTNDGSITGGDGGTKTAGDGPSGGAGAGNTGVYITNGSLTNNGQITGGRGGDYTGTFNLGSGNGGAGAQFIGGSLVNNGHDPRRRTGHCASVHWRKW